MSSRSGRVKSIQNKEATLAVLYEEYYNRIARYVYIRIGNKADAEDLAGEVFLKALQSLKSYKERGIPCYRSRISIAVS